MEHGCRYRIEERAVQLKSGFGVVENIGIAAAAARQNKRPFSTHRHTLLYFISSQTFDSFLEYITNISIIKLIYDSN